MRTYRTSILQLLNTSSPIDSSSNLLFQHPFSKQVLLLCVHLLTKCRVLQSPPSESVTRLACLPACLTSAAFSISSAGSSLQPQTSQHCLLTSLVKNIISKTFESFILNSKLFSCTQLYIYTQLHYFFSIRSITF